MYRVILVTCLCFAGEFRHRCNNCGLGFLKNSDLKRHSVRCKKAKKKIIQVCLSFSLCLSLSLSVLSLFASLPLYLLINTPSAARRPRRKSSKSVCLSLSVPPLSLVVSVSLSLCPPSLSLCLWLSLSLCLLCLCVSEAVTPGYQASTFFCVFKPCTPPSG